MKTYRVTTIDWTYEKGKILSTTFVKGLKAAREASRVPLSWCVNANVWWGWDGYIEVIACEC